jgi:arylsulfatase
VSELYKAPARFKGGTIDGVAVDVGKETYEDLEREAKRLLMKQ